MFKIDKSVPIPDRRTERRGRRGKYPFRHMNVGDSFFVPLPSNRAPGSLYAAISMARKRLGITLITDWEEGGMRIWRVGATTENPLKSSPDSLLQS